MVSPRSATFTAPWVAAPAISDRITQPTVSSTTPADRMTSPMLRLVRSRSTKILAITGIAEIDMAVARKRLNSIRWDGIGQVAVGEELPQAEAEREGEHHPHHRGDERRAAQVAEQAQVGLESREQEEQRHPHAPERVEQMVLRGLRGKDQLERFGRVVAEQAGAEGDAAQELADHRRKPEALEQLRADPGDRHQQPKLKQQQENRVPGEALDGGVQRPRDPSAAQP